jgi:hypothetical protein
MESNYPWNNTLDEVGHEEVSGAMHCFWKKAVVAFAGMGGLSLLGAEG